MSCVHPGSERVSGRYNKRREDRPSPLHVSDFNMAPKTKALPPVRRARQTLKRAARSCVRAQQAFACAKAAVQEAETEMNAAASAIAAAREAAWHASWEDEHSAAAWNLGEAHYTLGEVQRDVACTHTALWHMREALNAEPDDGISEADVEVIEAARQASLS